jgi:hypothetical protein
MKRTIVLVLLVMLMLNCTYTLKQYNEYTVSEPIIISNRVGEVIDADEREQFGLLEGIENFRSAQYFSVADGGYDVVIQTTYAKFIAYNRDPDAVQILRDYLNRYEVIHDSMTAFEKKWNIVDYDDLGQPITRNEVHMSVERVWQRYLPVTCATAGCIGSCLIFGAPSPAMDVPSDYDNSEDKEKILYAVGSTVVGGVAGWLVGKELDKRIALSKIKEARKPRVIEGE